MADPVNASIVEHFRTREDPRMARTKKPLLLAILVIALGTRLSGGEGFQAMALLGQSTRAWLQTFLAWPHGSPSHDTFGRVVARLHPQRFQECVLAWTQAVAQRTQGALISLDGKTVQASFDRATASSPWHMLSAWCAESGGLVVGQSKTASQANASPAMPDLFHVLAITGCRVTSDAMGGQTASARPSRDQGGADLWAWKGNHKKADTAVKHHFHQHLAPQLAGRTAANCFAAFDASHGRTVRRRVWTITDIAALPALAPWPSLPSVMVVATLRRAPQQAPVTSDDRVSISRLVRSATAFVTMIRQHWDSEQKLHGSLDVTCHEDRCRIRQDHAPENGTAARHIARNRLRQEHSHRMSLRQKRLFCGLDEHSLLMVLSRAT